MWNILEEAQRLIHSKQDVCLVTLVESKGSTYRRPGAKMIVSQEKQMVGAISGGCLENDVAEYAQDVLAKKKSQLIEYELDDDVVFGLGLGCGGSISLLVEPISKHWLTHLFGGKQEAVLAKIIESDHDSIDLGTQCLYQDGHIVWENKDVDLGDELVALSQKALKSQGSTIEEITIDNKRVRLFFDYIPLPNQLAIFGAGNDVIPVAKLAIEAGFKVLIIDSNAHNYSESKFPGTSFVTWVGQETVAQLGLNKNTACLVMSHHIERDAAALEMFLQTEAYYIGLLGPKHRYERLVENYYSLDKQKILTDPRVFAPVGLDIGSETPIEIAISILSEIIAVRNNQTAGSLRTKDSAIH